MEKYKSQYPTLRQAKTKWSKPSIVAKQGEGPSHDWYDMLRKDAKAKLAASIYQSKMGSVTRQQKIVHEETDDQHIYHVTHTKHVDKICKQGIMPMKTSNWVKAGDKERYGGGEVYAFTHKADAHAWAGRMDWAHHQTLGSGKISIITAKRPSDRKFEVDTNDPLSQAGKKGDWLKTHGSIEPHHIVSVEPYHPKKLGEDKVAVYDFNTQLQNVRMKETGVKRKKKMKDPRPTDFSRPDLKEAKDRIGKPTPSAEEIAKKHGLSVDQINAQIKKGIEVEKEHTNDEAEAHEIARDHLDEFPDYYDRLGAMEKAAKKEMKEDLGSVQALLGSTAAAVVAGATFGPSMEYLKNKIKARKLLKGKKPEKLKEATMIGSGPDAPRHAGKYITPYVGQKETHTLKRDVEHIPAGSKVTVHGHKVIDGKYHAIVSGGGSSKKVHAPFPAVQKPVKAKNKGLDYENKFVKTLNKHGLMKGKGAGSTSGNDFHLINKTTGEVHHGKVAEHAYQGESKKDLSAAYGQASLSHHPKKGWHFSDKTKERFPHYTAAIEKASVTVGKKTKPLLKHVNDEFGAPHPTKKSSHNIYSDHTDLHPAHAYMKDHGVDVLHIGSHGTYRAGLSHHKDRTPLGLPKTEGEGRFRVRQKHRNSLTVQFNIKHLEKSSVHLDNPEHLHEIKKKLGHTLNESYDPDVEQTRNRIEAHKKVAERMAQTHGEHSQEAAFHRAYVKHMQKQLKDQYGLEEEVANSVGGGNIAGMPTRDTPDMTPVRGPILRRKKFAGKTVFVVKPDTFYKSYLGKRKYEHYEKFLEGCEGFEEIRDFGRKHWDEPIILEDETTGAMVYLKYGRK